VAKAATRRCTQCGETRPLSDFHLDKRTGTPRAWCKPCSNAYNRAYRRRNLAHVRARDRRYWHKYKAKRDAYERRPDVRRKRSVRQAAYWAVKTGILPTRTACEHCGATSPPARLHRHHPDYSDPLRIVWLCTLCHGEEHRRLNDERRKAEGRSGKRAGAGGHTAHATRRGAKRHARGKPRG